MRLGLSQNTHAFLKCSSPNKSSTSGNGYLFWVMKALGLQMLWRRYKSFTVEDSQRQNSSLRGKNMKDTGFIMVLQCPEKAHETSTSR